MKNYHYKYAIILPLLLIQGCSVEKPVDASKPKASEAWVKSSLKKAGKATNTELRVQGLINTYQDAKELQVFENVKFTNQLNAIPRQVHVLAMQTKNLEAFEWSISQGIPVDSSYNALLEYWKLGADWQDYMVVKVPNKALPIFMSQAADTYNVRFLDQHVEDFKATGYKVNHPLEKTEFNVRFCSFLAEELDEALEANDQARIEFLLNQIPALPSVVYINRQTEESMRAVGDYVFAELKDEKLSLQLLNLGYEYNLADKDLSEFGQPMSDFLKANPEYAVRMLKLEEWNGIISDAAAKPIFSLPNDTLHTVHKLHIDEAIQSGMKTGNTEDAIRLIEWKAEQKPLNQGSYTELINWSLDYGNPTVFDYVMKHCKELDLFKIDFALLAKNQQLFVQYAPMIMRKVYYTTGTNPRPDGTTIGRIKQVFACSNEDAGLYLVQKYNLSQAWVKATKGQSMLMDVCDTGNLKSARYLIEQRGENIRTETGYSKLEISVFGSTQPTEGKLSAIFFAAKSGNPELIKYLASKGAHVNARSNFHTTPLMHAVSGGHLEAVKTLIALRADVNAQMNSMDLRKIGSYDEISNAYRRAKASGNEEMLNLLKEAGAHP